MQFSCDRDVLAAALSASGRAATTRTGTLPVLSGIKVSLSGDVLTVTGTDLELSIETTVEVSGISDGAVVVPARLTADIVRSLHEGPVTIDASDPNSMSIASARAQFSVRPMMVTDFPVTGEVEAAPVVMPVAAFATGLSQVVKAASSDDARAVLTGVLLSADGGKVNMVATDSYRLAVKELDGSELLGAGQKVLIPSRALAELQRVVDDPDAKITVRFGSREAMFEFGEYRVRTRLIEGEYPNWENLVPSGEQIGMVVPRDTISEALRRVEILATDSTPVQLTLTRDGIELSAITQDVGNASEFVDGSYDGDELTVAFNPDYLAAGIDAVEGDEVVLFAQTATRPVVLRGVGFDDYLYLLMPVRVP